MPWKYSSLFLSPALLLLLFPNLAQNYIFLLHFSLFPGPDCLLHHFPIYQSNDATEDWYKIYLKQSNDISCPRFILYEYHLPINIRLFTHTHHQPISGYVLLWSESISIWWSRRYPCEQFSGQIKALIMRGQAQGVQDNYITERQP